MELSFSDIVNELVYMNKKRRKEMMFLTGDFAPTVMFLEEICTVSCDNGRACGKTSYILENALSGDLIVVPNFLERIYQEKIEGRAASPSIVTAEHIWRNTAGRAYNTIYVDEPGWVFSQLIDGKRELYNLIFRNGYIDQQTFVLLGRQ